MPARSLKIVLILALVAAAISACGGAVTTASNSPVPSAMPSQATASPLASPTISPSPTATASPAPNAGGGSVLGAISTLFVIVLGALALFLVVALSYLGIKNFTNFRTTIDNKEWILAPATHIDEVTQVAGLLQDRVAKLASEVSALSEALAERREHLQILAASIAEHDDKLKKATLGVEHHARERSLRHLALIAEILEIDSRSGIDAKATVGGIKVELEQLLEENGVTTYEPKPGEKLPQRGVSLKRVKTIPAPQPELAGTVKSVESPAYIYVGPNGQEVLLHPMSITVYGAPTAVEKEA